MTIRYFSLDQAQGLLPEVTRLVHLAKESRERLEKGGIALARLIGRIEVMGGLNLDPRQQARLMADRRSALEVLKETMESLELLGVQVSDLDAGAVDFPTRYRGRDASLSWRVGEGAIRYWRPFDQPPNFRKEIDAEFLNAHQGGPVH
jgi:hypothetical protein